MQALGTSSVSTAKTTLFLLIFGVFALRFCASSVSTAKNGLDEPRFMMFFTVLGSFWGHFWGNNTTVRVHHSRFGTINTLAAYHIDLILSDCVCVFTVVTELMLA